MIRALLELQFADPERANNFRCAKCPASVQKLRRCHEDRWDFTEDDAHFWPIQVVKGGETYNFCPGKATRDFGAVSLYNSVTLTAETGTMWTEGGISAQPAWYVDLVTAFVPMYNELKFISRAKAILGDGKKGGNSNGSNQRQAKVHNRS